MARKKLKVFKASVRYTQYRTVYDSTCYTISMQFMNFCVPELRLPKGGLEYLNHLAQGVFVSSFLEVPFQDKATLKDEAISILFKSLRVCLCAQKMFSVFWKIQTYL